MNLHKRSLQVWAILVILLLTGCGAAEPQSEMVEVTFDGKGCTVSGSGELPVGDHKFLYRNQSEEELTLNVSRLIDDHTFQEFLDKQSEPGDFFPHPGWILQQPVVGQIWDETLGGEIQTIRIKKEGEHVIFLLSRKNVWICAPLEVNEALSG